MVLYWSDMVWGMGWCFRCEPNQAKYVKVKVNTHCTESGSLLAPPDIKRGLFGLCQRLCDDVCWLKGALRLARHQQVTCQTAHENCTGSDECGKRTICNETEGDFHL